MKVSASKRCTCMSGSVPCTASIQGAENGGAFASAPCAGALIAAAPTRITAQAKAATRKSAVPLLAHECALSGRRSKLKSNIGGDSHDARHGRNYETEPHAKITPQYGASCPRGGQHRHPRGLRRAQSRQRGVTAGSATY